MYKRNAFFVVVAVMAAMTWATPLPAQEVYLVGADNYGKSNYILCNMDGTFGSQEYMGQLPQPYYTYGNGIGDFDNDGDFDYIIGTGYSSSSEHHIYLYEKTGDGNTFAGPVSVATWTEGYYPMDMAVADYNNDGNMDFVLTHYGSSNCELYLGNGDLTFSVSVLSSTAPFYNIGADAADFNNDGLADFVASDYDGTEIYINLGNGDGTFVTTSFSGASSSWGVTAADFDNDGSEDIITDNGGGNFYFYKGNGDGTFQSAAVISGMTGPGISPLDNFDLNDDGNMDVVFGGNTSDVYFYSGNGDGTFTYVTQISGGSGDMRYNLTAPPAVIAPTGRPVAVIIPASQGILVGGTAGFDGSGSYDTDGGTIVSYDWDFGDGGTGTGVAVSHTYVAEGTYKVRLTVTDNDGKTGKRTATVFVAGPPRVNVMPGNQPGEQYKYTWPGRELVVWGNVHSGVPPMTYVWDFGDGSPSESGTVTDPKYIAVNHTYASMGPKQAMLTVTDAVGQSDQDVVEIEVAARDLQVEVNAAVENGLRFLYINQQPDGRWSDGWCDIATTAMTVLTFENQGHLPINDFDKDIYAEYVRLGLDYLTSQLLVQTLDVQAYGDPEEVVPGNTDNNGIGLYPMCCYPGYETGMVLMAIVGAGPAGSPAPDLLAPNGPANVIGRTYRELAVDIVDYLAWAQNEAGGGFHRGGWRYDANYSSSDNSVSQWPPIGLEAAETNWGISPPGFVKSELQLWINNTQLSGGYTDGAFNYSEDWWFRDGVPATGAGICEMAFCDIPQSDTRFQRALAYLERAWASGYNKGLYYSMYGIAKGCRIAVNDFGELSEVNYIGSIEWYPDYAQYLVSTQNADGSWPASEIGGPQLGDAWALLVLQRTIVGGRPVAVINAPATVPPDEPFDLGGSGSYHMDPDKSIVEWLWDFDKADGVDWNNPDGAGTVIEDHIYSLAPGDLADTHVVTLRVADNSIPEMTDIAEHIIIVNFDNHRPIADPNGPYAAKIGEMITFNGSGSHDPDESRGDHIVSYSWDLDGDGVFGDCTNPICTRSWGYVYSGYVGLVVTDSYGATSDTGKAYVTVWTSRMDVGLTASDISFSKPAPQPHDAITITAVIHCDPASDPVSNVLVRFYDGDPDIAVHQIGGDQVILSMMAGDAIPVAVPYTVGDTLPREIYVRADANGSIQEFNEDNNEAFKVIERWQVFTIKAVMLPNLPWYTGWVSDPLGTVRAYIGNWPAGYAAASVVPGSIRFNDQVPIYQGRSRIRPSMAGFTGDVLEVAFGRPLAIQTFGNPPAPGNYVATISGQFTDGGKFVAAVQVTLADGLPKLADETEDATIPDSYVLGPAYPNPFNANTMIEFGLPEAGQVKLEIYNVMGQKVRTLVDRHCEAGYQSVTWNGIDDWGEPAGSGIYFYRLTTEGFTEAKKMVLMK